MTKSDFLQAEKNIFKSMDDKFDHLEAERKADRNYLTMLIISSSIGLAGIIITALTLIR